MRLRRTVLLPLLGLASAACSFDRSGLAVGPTGPMHDGARSHDGAQRDGASIDAASIDAEPIDAIPPDTLRPDMGPPFPALRWVAPDGKDMAGCGGFLSPCLTIGFAIATGGACRGGMTIGLGAGTYTQNIVLPSGCSLRGVGRGRVTVSGSGKAGSGPVITVSGGSTTIEDMTITNGFADGMSGQPDDGGGVLWNNGTGTIRRVIIKDNTATETGGGVHLINGALTIAQSFIWFNNATGTGGGNGGAGIAVSGGALTLVDDLIADNIAAQHGGGLFVYGGTASVRSVTFADNQALSGVSIDVTGGSSVSSLDSTVAWNSTVPAAAQLGGTACTAKCDIQGVATTLNVDPLFVAPSAKPPNYALLGSSPLIGAGSCPVADPRDLNGYSRSGADGGADCEIGAYDRKDPGVF